MPTYSKSEHLLIETARSLFWEYGISRVSVEEICENAEVSKMTFYRRFENKLDIAKAVLDELIQEGVKTHENIMSQDISFEQKINLSITQKIKNAHNISQEFILDAYKNEPELVKYLEKHRKKGERMFIKELKRAQKSGEISQSLKVPFIKYLLNRISEMAHDENLLALYKRPEKMIEQLVHFFFYGIMEKSNDR